MIVTDKTKLNIRRTKRVLDSWLKIEPFYFSREYQYIGNSRIVCEEMLEYNITDYKFFCFDGIARYVEVYKDRFGNHKKSFYDMNWTQMPFNTANDPVSDYIVRPDNFDEMKEIAERLSKNISFVRVDLYSHNKQIYFGEMTFHPAGGYTPITPREWDYRLGQFLKV